MENDMKPMISIDRDFFATMKRFDWNENLYDDQPKSMR